MRFDNQKSIDWLLLIIPIIIVGLGITTFLLIGTEGVDIAQKQILLLIVGILFFFLVSSADYRIFKNNSFPSIIFYLFTTGLLILTLFAPEIRGAQAWITIAGVTFEPSEIAKLSLLILLAKYFSQKHSQIYQWQHILASGIYASIPSVLTLLQSDFGSMIIFVALWLGMLLFAGINKKHLFAIVMIGVIVGTIGWFVVLKDYQQDRFISFLNPYSDPQGTGYNTLQARTTLGSGKWLGSYFTGQKDVLSVLVPEPYTDFIFATFGQKFGFIGIAVLLILLITLLIRIGSIGLESNNNFAKLYSLGLITIIFTHFIINGGMNLGIMPITGIPFPFMSLGGSHLVTLMIGLGLSQSIRYRS